MSGVRITSRFSFPRPFSSRKIDAKLTRAQRRVADDAEQILVMHAPKESGNMARRIRSRREGGDILIVVDAKDERGYDYTGVTRFGHREARIVPKRSITIGNQTFNRRQSVVETGRPLKTGGSAALRFMFGGRVMYARSVKAYHPKSDWVEDALPQIRQAQRRSLRLMKREVELEN